MARLRVALWIFGLGLSVGCGGGGGSSNPAGPSGQPPTISSFSVGPGFGISQVSSFTLTSAAVDPDGDPLTYRWEFPGGALSSASGSVVMSGDGAAAVRLTVTDTGGRSATATQSVTLGSMGGTWTGDSHCGRFEFTFTQTGTRVTGSGRTIQPWCNAQAGTLFATDPAEPGRIDASGNVEIRFKAGNFIDAYLRGQMDSSGRRVTGGMFNSGFTGQPFTLTK